MDIFDNDKAVSVGMIISDKFEYLLFTKKSKPLKSPMSKLSMYSLIFHSIEELHQNSLVAGTVPLNMIGAYMYLMYYSNILLNIL